ncbi:hypothetical protein GCM10027259_29980 [Micromonospora palomenae]
MGPESAREGAADRHEHPGTEVEIKPRNATEQQKLELLPTPPTGLADGFGREERPTTGRGPRIHPGRAWVPGS